jgi:ATP-dependent phosphoenolpyruvate carboxykinase
MEKQHGPRVWLVNTGWGGENFKPSESGVSAAITAAGPR